ncbi:MAG TPA: UDP-N-acetylmuramoyl-L-alanine--D-glutamate ligase [Microbacteriaceae bacterium]|nr:UDP-N-acetylmuramoyl-L-alanine--D-glutamate ligase [Microbacteriaceae bacterium]
MTNSVIKWSKDDVLALKSWHDNWRGLKVAVLGLGVTGFSVADTLAELGAKVLVIAGSKDDNSERLLEVIGAKFVQKDSDEEQLYELKTFNPDLVIVSPGYRPKHPLTEWAIGQDIPVWGDIELGWRLRDKTSKVAHWVCVTGTNGKTTTSQLTAHMLLAGGLRAAPVGNIGVPILDALRDPQGFDVLVVELSSFQLARLGEISPYASVCINIADDHLDWHGGRDEYIKAKAKIYNNTQVACVYNRQDPITEQMVVDADVVEGARAVSFGLDTPPVSGFGLVEGLLIDRGFHEERTKSALELYSMSELKKQNMGSPHLVQDILAAAALARSLGVSPEEITSAIKQFKPDDHRMQLVLHDNEIQWIDDSKATNAHAAEASLKSYSNIVWVAGGLFKGQNIDDLIKKYQNKFRAVIVIGKDRDELLQALSRHAKNVPVFEIDEEHTETVMKSVVKKAKAIAQKGDAVLLSPAASSLDQFDSYEDRGRRFAEAVKNSKGDDGVGGRQNTAT